MGEGIRPATNQTALRDSAGNAVSRTRESGFCGFSMEYSMTGTERIDVELKKRGLSRRELAIKAGIPPSSFQSAMERNNGFSSGMLVKIAAAFDVDIDGLIAIIQGSEHSETKGATTGALIQSERKKAGMTQAELGERAGITAAALSRYELGQRKIGINALQRISSALNVNMFQLCPENERADAVIDYLRWKLRDDSFSADELSDVLSEIPEEYRNCTVTTVESNYVQETEPDKPDENFLNALARLKNAPIVHDGMGGGSEIVFQGLTARWRDAVGLYGSPTCSNCGSGAALKTRFCPHCGAKMEDVT